MQSFLALAAGALMGLAFLIAGASLQAAPVVTFSNGDHSVIELTGGNTAAHVTEADDTLFMISENTGVDAEVLVNRVADSGEVQRSQYRTISGKFDSHLFFFDKVGRSRQVEILEGTISFHSEILGILIDKTVLQGANSLPFYRAGVGYQGGGSINGDDGIALDAHDPTELSFRLRVNIGQDTFRVLTRHVPPGFAGGGLEDSASVPVPGLAALLAVAALVLRRRSCVSP